MPYLIIALLCPILLMSSSLPIDKALSPKEQEETGIANLSDSQKKAFEAWIEAWTRRILDRAPSYHDSLSLEEWMETWPEHQKPGREQTAKARQSRKETNRAIFRNNRGQTLTLFDGSEWKVRSIDVKIAMYWKRGEKIEIETDSRDIRRPYILKNISRDTEVGATMLKSASQSGERKEDSPSYFRGSMAIKAIDSEGKTLTTADNTVWTIAPADREWVQENWKTKDRVRIRPGPNSQYPKSIENLDFGDKALASPSREG